MLYYNNINLDTRLLPAVNKGWQDQLWLIGGTLHSNQDGGNDGNNKKDKDSGFAIGHLLDELKGRLHDLEILFDLYDPNSEKNRTFSQSDSNETREHFGQLLQNIEKRQSTVNKSLEANNVSIKNDVKQNNKEWKQLVKKSGQSQQATVKLQKKNKHFIETA